LSISTCTLILSAERGEVEGLTEFRPGLKPRVRISAALAGAPRFENRLRTTLTHELGHVHFHRFLFDLPPWRDLLFPVPGQPQMNKCRRETIVGAKPSDWMEWQAGYACGALLMPRGALQLEVQTFSADRGTAPGLLSVQSPDGIAITSRVAEVFHASRDAARVRLIQCGYLDTGHGDGQQGLFR
jgi:hypothetical protein